MIIELRILSSRSQAHLDLDVSIEKMITGLRIISSRTQGRPVKGRVEKDTKRRSNRMAKRVKENIT